MNLDTAIAAHAQWKIKFRKAIDGKEQLDNRTICRDDCCELGKWLHGEGKRRHGASGEFQTLMLRHKAFHTEAGKVADAINLKLYDRAIGMLENATPFSTASNRVGVAVLALRKIIS